MAFTDYSRYADHESYSAIEYAKDKHAREGSRLYEGFEITGYGTGTIKVNGGIAMNNGFVVELVGSQTFSEPSGSYDVYIETQIVISTDENVKGSVKSFIKIGDFSSAVNTQTKVNMLIGTPTSTDGNHNASVPVRQVNNVDGNVDLAISVTNIEDTGDKIKLRVNTNTNGDHKTNHKYTDVQLPYTQPVKSVNTIEGDVDISQSITNIEDTGDKIKFRLNTNTSGSNGNNNKYIDVQLPYTQPGDSTQKVLSIPYDIPVDDDSITLFGKYIYELNALYPNTKIIINTYNSPNLNTSIKTLTKYPSDLFEVFIDFGSNVSSSGYLKITPADGSGVVYEYVIDNFKTITSAGDIADDSMILRQRSGIAYDGSGYCKQNRSHSKYDPSVHNKISLLDFGDPVDSGNWEINPSTWESESEFPELFGTLTADTAASTTYLKFHSNTNKIYFNILDSGVLSGWSQIDSTTLEYLKGYFLETKGYQNGGNAMHGTLNFLEGNGIYFRGHPPVGVDYDDYEGDEWLIYTKETDSSVYMYMGNNYHPGEADENVLRVGRAIADRHIKAEWVFKNIEYGIMRDDIWHTPNNLVTESEIYEGSSLNPVFKKREQDYDVRTLYTGDIVEGATVTLSRTAQDYSWLKISVESVDGSYVGSYYIPVRSSGSGFERSIFSFAPTSVNTNLHTGECNTTISGTSATLDICSFNFQTVNGTNQENIRGKITSIEALK